MELDEDIPMLNKVANVIKLVAIFSWIAGIIFFALTKSINLPTQHLDGAFQTASGLFRLDAGQYPGKDFYPYLGIGPLFILFPLFKLFGSDLASSIIAAHIAIATVVMLANAFIYHMVLKPKSISTSIAVGCILFYVIATVDIIVFHINPDSGLLDWLFAGSSPGNSLRPLRAFVPYVVAIILYLFVFRITEVRIKYLASGLLTSTALLWSNDYAFSTALLLGVFLLFYSYLRGELTIKIGVLYAAATIFSWATIFSLVCHGHTIEMWEYNFADVAQDQWWYFGPYGESSRIFTFSQFFNLLMSNKFGLIFLIFLGIQTFRHRSIELALLLWVGVALYAGGVVASVGGHIDPAYFSPYNNWLLVTVLICASRYIWLYAPKFSFVGFTNPAISIAGSMLLIIVAIPMAVSIYQYRRELINAMTDHNRFFVNELGGYLKNEWGDYVLLARSTSKDLRVVEEYWGIWSSLRRSFSIWPVDSVIHALGHTRTIARQNLQHADIVISTRLTAPPATVWQPWSLSQNYWFYERLLTDWSISALSPSTIVWKRGVTVPPVSVQCEVKRVSGDSFLKINVPSQGYYEVAMQYKITGNGRGLIMMQNNISFAADADGYVSIDPKATRVEFPAYFKQAEQAQLNVKVIGNHETVIDVSSCAAKQIAIHNEEVLPLSKNTFQQESVK